MCHGFEIKNRYLMSRKAMALKQNWVLGETVV